MEKGAKNLAPYVIKGAFCGILACNHHDVKVVLEPVAARPEQLLEPSLDTISNDRSLVDLCRNSNTDSTLRSR